jgi:hypothetical protein
MKHYAGLDGLHRPRISYVPSAMIGPGASERRGRRFKRGVVASKKSPASWWTGRGKSHKGLTVRKDGLLTSRSEAWAIALA